MKKNVVLVTSLVILSLTFIILLDNKTANLGVKITSFAGGGGSGEIEVPPDISGSCPCGNTPVDTCAVNNTPYYCQYLGLDENGAPQCTLAKKCDLCGCIDGKICDTEMGVCLDPESLLGEDYDEEVFNNPESDPEKYKELLKVLQENLKLRQPLRFEGNINYEFEFKEYEVPFAKLMTPTFKRIISRAPKESPNLLYENLTTINTTEGDVLKSPDSFPEGAIRITGFKTPENINVQLSPGERIKDFEILVGKVNNQPKISLDLGKLL